MVVMIFLDMDNIDKVVMFLDELCVIGIIVLLLDVNVLEFMFVVIELGEFFLFGC